VSNIDETLNNFSRVVLGKAFKVRESIELDLKKRKKDIMEEKEIFLLGEAYKKIQANKMKIIQQANENISKARLDGQKELIIRRNYIIKEIFDDVDIKIKEFVDSDKYYDWLFGKIKDSIKNIDDNGSIKIFLNKSDEKYLEKLGKEICKFCEAKKFELDIVMDNDIVGGALISNSNSNYLINISIKEKINEAKKQFLKQSGLTVE